MLLKRDRIFFVTSSKITIYGEVPKIPFVLLIVFSRVIGANTQVGRLIQKYVFANFIMSLEKD